MRRATSGRAPARTTAEATVLCGRGPGRAVSGGLALAAGLLLAGCARTVTIPEQVAGGGWAGEAATPAGRDYTPKAAVKQRIDGEVWLLCLPQPGGGVGDCAVQREEPAGWGFAAAALQMAPHYLRSGREATVAGRVQVRVLFCHDRPSLCRRPISHAATA